MSLIVRISNRFDSLDSAYSELYENHLEFEKNPTFENKQKVMKSIGIIKLRISEYKSQIKDYYIKEN